MIWPFNKFAKNKIYRGVEIKFKVYTGVEDVNGQIIGTFTVTYQNEELDEIYGLGKVCPGFLSIDGETLFDQLIFEIKHCGYTQYKTTAIPWHNIIKFDFVGEKKYYRIGPNENKKGEIIYCDEWPTNN